MALPSRALGSERRCGHRRIFLPSASSSTQNLPSPSNRTAAGIARPARARRPASCASIARADCAHASWACAQAPHRGARLRHAQRLRTGGLGQPGGGKLLVRVLHQAEAGLTAAAPDLPLRQLRHLDVQRRARQQVALREQLAAAAVHRAQDDAARSRGVTAPTTRRALRPAIAARAGRDTRRPARGRTPGPPRAFASCAVLPVLGRSRAGARARGPAMAGRPWRIRSCERAAGGASQRRQHAPAGRRRARARTAAGRRRERQAAAVGQQQGLSSHAWRPSSPAISDLPAAASTWLSQPSALRSAAGAAGSSCAVLPPLAGRATALCMLEADAGLRESAAPAAASSCASCAIARISCWYCTRRRLGLGLRQRDLGLVAQRRQQLLQPDLAGHEQRVVAARRGTRCPPAARGSASIRFSGTFWPLET